MKLRHSAKWLSLLILHVLSLAVTQSHPLGIFSTNRYARIEVDSNAIRIVYVIDVAEIPAIQEIRTIDRNGDGVTDSGEQKEYADQRMKELSSGISLTVDGVEMPLVLSTCDLSFVPGQGGLKTIRLASVFTAGKGEINGKGSLHFLDRNFAAGLGWQEIVAQAGNGMKIMGSSVPERDVTNELRVYPPEMLSTPFHVSEASLEFERGTENIATPSIDAGVLSFVQSSKDGFAELISTKELSFPVMIGSLLIAMILGAAHALTPGHGKTIVAAYLVGSRGTVGHAAFLGLTVTVTHTIGVFAMGLVALYASQYILPGTLYPWLSMLSGLMVAGIGISLLRKRIRMAREKSSHHHDPPGHHHPGVAHSHGGRVHSHLPPGVDGSPVTWKSLLTLGVSGGLLPCPSAIVVLLGAVALGRIAFGMLLIVAFGVGLAGVLTGIGIAIVHARKYLERFETRGPLFRWLPVVSAVVVTVAGVVLAFEASQQATFQPVMNSLLGAASAMSSIGVASVPVLGLGFVLGLKHALDADHLVAVSTIVSERKGFLSSSIVGAMWGIGHTTSLFIVGLCVIALRLRIPEQIAEGMEFSVALMLVFLGGNVLLKLLRGGKFHTHVHTHGDHIHIHPHIHEHSHTTIEGSAHHPVRLSFARWMKSVREQIGHGKRSIFIGMVHGMAGSAALMLLVLATIPSPVVGLVYILVFGIGSIGGMLLMSMLIGVPFIFSARGSERINLGLRGIAGTMSVLFGLYLAWQIGDSLFL